MKLFSLPEPTSHQIKSYYVFSHRDLQKQTNVCFQGTSKMQFSTSRNIGVQMFFLTPNRSMFTGKFLANSEKVWLCCKTYYFQCGLRFVKGVRFFERNCIVKWVIFFGRFCWLWHFLDKLNSEYVHWNVLHARKNVFKKANFKYEILNHLYFGSNFVFWWTALGRFSQCFAFVQFFNVAPPPPAIKKFPAALFTVVSSYQL